VSDPAYSIPIVVPMNWYTDDGADYTPGVRTKSSPPVVSSTPRYIPRIASPPRTPGRAVSYASDGMSDFGDDGDELPPAFLTPWTVDPNINIPENFILSGVDLTSASLPDRMKNLMDDYAYWLSLVERLGFDRTIFRFDEDHTFSLEVLSRYFDSSHLGLLRVFHIFDKDKDALITRGEIAEGLLQQGFYTNIGSQSADLAFGEFCDLLTRSGNSSSASTYVVSPPEFLLALRCLRLAAVVHGYMHPTQIDNESGGRDILIHYHEYREDKIWTHLPLEGPISFLFRAPDAELESTCRVHWIHAHEPTVRTVLALGVKYGLDPRFTLDVLSLWNQQALVDRSLSYVARSRGEMEGKAQVMTSASGTDLGDAVFLDREWIFTIIPVLKLSEASACTLTPFNEWRREDMRQGGKSRVPPPDVFVEVETCNVGMFVTGQPVGGTAITFSTEWSVMGEVDTSNDLDGDEDTPPSTPTGGVSRSTSLNSLSATDFRVFNRVMIHLRTSYSHIRTGDTHTLYLKSLWDITEDYLAVIQAYEAVLTIMRIRLFQKLDSLEHFEVRRIQTCLRQTSLILRLMRPVAAVVDLLEGREWSGESKLYLSDLKANVSRFIDHIGAVRETAKLLGDQYRNYCETRTRRVLFLLTLVTTIFVPCIFITSLEGMNFAYMPEMQLKNVYIYFWIIIVAIVSCLLMFYRKKKWI
jgi:Mg2+ and Co2+ transporter CorA